MLLNPLAASAARLRLGATLKTAFWYYAPTDVLMSA
jgi:hypothetical protein